MKRVERKAEREEQDKLDAVKAVTDAAANAEKKIALDQSADKAASFFKSAPEAVPEGAEDEDDEEEDEAAGGASGSGAKGGGEGGGEGWGEEVGDWSEGDEEGEEEEAFESSVSCVTADYAMQNVILQMNMRLLTPVGLYTLNQSVAP
jgi:RNA-binding protein NOB1